MARSVSEDLKSFKKKVGPNLSVMSGSVSEITSKIDSLNAAVNSSKAEIEGAYKSSGDDNQALIKLANTSEIINQMKSDIESTINGAISKSNSLLSKIDKLEELERTIKTNESTVSSESGRETPDETKLSNARSALRMAESDFDRLSSESEELLAALKAFDSSLEAQEDNSTQNTESNLNTLTEYMTNLKYGSFTLQTFQDSKGNKMQYYLYVPDGVENIKGLPVMMYMHGAGADMSLNGILNYGLSAKINSKQVTPQGIVICPYITKFNSDQTLETLKELTDEVVKKYDGDKDIISLSGHSYGGQTVYDLINKYPNYYAAAVPISGAHNVTEAFKTVSTWIFHGEFDVQGDSSRTTHYDSSVRANNAIQSMGGTSKMQKVEHTGHAYCQNKTYEGKYVSPDGKEEYVLDWAFRQKKKTASA